MLKLSAKFVAVLASVALMAAGLFGIQPASAATTGGLPPAPVGVRAVPGNGGLTLYWLISVTGIDDYQIQQQIGTGTWTTIERTPSSTTSQQVTGLSNGVTYRYRVAARNTSGLGPWSSILTATPQGPPNAPSAPTVSSAPGQFIVVWQAPAANGSAINGYQIQVAASATPDTWVTKAQVSATTLQTQISGLPDKDSYQARVIAQNQKGSSPASSPSASLYLYDLPEAPTGVVATGQNGSVKLSWTASTSSGVTGYRAYRSSVSGATACEATSTATECTVEGLQNGSSYTFVVVALNQNGRGIPSAVVTGRPVGPPARPSAPTLAQNGLSLVANWRAPQDGGSPLTDYSLQYSLDRTTWVDIDEPRSAQASSSMVLPAATYQVRVAARNALGVSDWSLASNQFVLQPLPDAPTAVTGNPATQKMELSWLAPLGQVKDYRIQYQLQDASSWTAFSDASSTATSTVVSGLQNGTAYNFRVAAVNIAGQGPWSDPVTATVNVAPPAPSTPTVSAGEGSVTLSWPAVTASPEVTDYAVAYSLNGITWTTFQDGVSASRSATITGLQNGVSYRFRVAGINAWARSAWSQAASGTPRSRPDAPVAPRALGGVSKATLNITAPSNNGASITDYAVQYSSDGGSTWLDYTDAVSSAVTINIQGLQNGTTYIFRVAAINSLGRGSWSAASNQVVPMGPPLAPAALTAEPSSRQVALSWQAPQTYGRAVLDYLIQYNTGGVTWVSVPHTPSNQTSITVTGLQNGTAYTFKVAAVTAEGAGAFSQTAGATPRSAPSAPQRPTAQAGDTTISLVWTAPLNGGSPILDYVIQTSSDGIDWVTFPDGTSTATSVSVTGLSNGVAQQVRIAAVNQAGQSEWSPTATATPKGRPLAPESLSATDASAKAIIEFDAPADQGAAISSYVAQVSLNSVTWQSAPSQTTVTGSSVRTEVTGLSNGLTYQVRIAATNQIGQGSWSTPVVTRPYSVPQAPQAPTVTSLDRSVQVSWQAPGDSGRSISDYALAYSDDEGVTWNDVTRTASTATSYTIKGLSNGTVYRVRVAAINQAGQGPWSVASDDVVPDGPGGDAPETPLSLTAEPSDHSVIVTWQEPQSMGPITSYQVRYSTSATLTDATTVSVTDTTASIGGLSVGDTWYFQVRARSVYGVSSWSDAVSAVPLAVPDAPSGVSLQVQRQALGVTWQAPQDNGSELLDYQVAYSTDGVSWQQVTVDASSLEATLTGLTPGVAHQVRVGARNQIGTSEWSTSQSSTPITDPATPLAPSVSWTPGRPGSATVIWDQVDFQGAGYTNLSSYRIDAGSDSCTTTSGTSCQIDGLQVGTQLQVTLTVTNDFDLYATSDPTSFTPATYPQAPNAPSVTLSSQPGTITISWQDLTDGSQSGYAPVDSYTVRSQIDGLTCTSQSTSCEIQGATFGSEYTFQVTAHNQADLASAPSESSPAVTPIDVPARMDPLSGSSGPARVTLTWQAQIPTSARPITGYHVLQDGVQVCETTQTTCVLTGLQGGVSRSYVVRAYNQMGEGPDSQAVSLAAGYVDTLAFSGDNSSGQRGSGNLSYSTLPVEVSGITPQKVSTGGSHACAIASGSLYCWGLNSNGQLGDNTTVDRQTPTLVGGNLSGKTVTDISAGTSHTCAVASGTAYCWGLNTGYQLGDGTLTQRLVPTAVSGLTAGTATQISAGNTHSCAITSVSANTSAYCWGTNASGQLGTGNTTIKSSATAVVTGPGLMSLTKVTKISVGGNHTCAISNSLPYCWGSNSSAQIGDTTTTARTTGPIAVTTGTGLMPLSGVTDISAGANHTCAVSTTSSVDVAYCWGSNTSGQLGDNSTTQRTAPVKVLATGALQGVAVQKITSGTSHTCTIDSSNRAVCWGLNDKGQLGDGTTTQRLVPTQASAPQGGTTLSISSASVGTSTTCTVASVSGQNKVYCFGSGTYGQLGSAYSNPTKLTSIATGTSLANRHVSSIAAQRSTGTHVCAVADGEVYCWGTNTNGQLGDGTTTSRTTPTKALTTGVLSNKTMTQVVVGLKHTCALDSQGVVYCWGGNTNGQVGDASTQDRSSPVQIAGAISSKTITKLASDTSHTCAIDSLGAAYCWGLNTNGQLGDNSTTQRTAPVAVYAAGALSGKSVTDITVGTSHTCAVASNAAYCWGLNTTAQLGDSTTTQRTAPVAVLTTGVLSNKTITKVAAGASHTCALDSQGVVYCWGQNTAGQIGDNATTQRNSPVIAAGSSTLTGKTVTQISAGNTTTCAIDSTGAAYCWGSNASGQIGDWVTTQRNSPTLMVTSTTPANKTFTQISVGTGMVMAIHSTAP